MFDEATWSSLPRLLWLESSGFIIPFHFLDGLAPFNIIFRDEICHLSCIMAYKKERKNLEMNIYNICGYPSTISLYFQGHVLLYLHTDILG